MTWYEHEERTERFKRPEPEEAMFPGCAYFLWDMMDRYLTSRDLDPDIARANGWYPTEYAGDSFARILMPAVRTDGHVFWQARALNPVLAKRYQSPYGARGDAVIVVRPLTKPKAAVMVEGPMDALAVAGAGLLGISVMGNTPPDAVLSHVCSLVKDLDRLDVIADSDSVQAWSYPVAYFSMAGIKTKLRYPYPYNDVAEMSALKRKVWLHA